MSAPTLKRVHQHHERDGGGSERGKQTTNVANQGTEQASLARDGTVGSIDLRHCLALGFRTPADRAGEAWSRRRRDARREV
jgi:hypothetical protein